MISIALPKRLLKACEQYAKEKISGGIGIHSERLSIRGADKDWVPWALGKQVEHGVAIWLGLPESSVNMNPRSRAELDGIDLTSRDGFTIDAKYTTREDVIWSAGKTYPKDRLLSKTFQLFVVGQCEMIYFGDAKSINLCVLVTRKDFMARRTLAGKGDPRGYDEHTQYLSFRDCVQINPGDTLQALLSRESIRRKKQFEYISGQWP